MLIVLEGPDGAGKTTLARDLLRFHALTKATVMHRGPIVQDPLDEYELPLQDYEPNTGQHVICDRLHLGEAVYGPVLRDGSKLDAPRLLHIHLFLQAKGALTVILRVPDQLLHRRLSGRGDDLVRLEHLPAIVQGYHELAGAGWADRYHYTTTKHNVFALAKQREKQVTYLSRYRTYVGGWKPAALLLGDRQNVRKSTTYKAAFVPFGGTSGHYLLGALRPGFGQRIGLANATEEDVGRLWFDLSLPPVICLGREAQKATKAAGVPHSTVPHPQYVRRFHNGLRQEYGLLIERLATLRADANLGGWPG